MRTFLLLAAPGLAASLVLAHGVVLTWMVTAALAPWPAVALGAEAALAAFGLAWIPLARRREGEEGLLTRTCAKGAVAGLFAAQVVALVAGLAPEPPSINEASSICVSGIAPSTRERTGFQKAAFT